MRPRTSTLPAGVKLSKLVREILDADEGICSQTVDEPTKHWCPQSILVVKEIHTAGRIEIGGYLISYCSATEPSILLSDRLVAWQSPETGCFAEAVHDANI